MPIYRNRISQTAFRNGVRQVAYRNGVRVLDVPITRNSDVLLVQQSTTGDDKGYRDDLNQAQAYGNLTRFLTISAVACEAIYYKSDDDLQSIRFNATTSVPFKSENTECIIELINSDGIQPKTIKHFPNFQFQGVSRYESLAGNSFIKDVDINDGKEINIGWKFITQWQPVTFDGTRFGVALSQGSFTQTEFLNFLLQSCYSDSDTDTTLLQFNGDPFDVYGTPDTRCTITVTQKNISGEVISQGEFIHSIEADWICDRAFLIQTSGSIEIYLRFL